jgi:lysophospholipase L1-like esterase
MALLKSQLGYWILAISIALNALFLLVVLRLVVRRGGLKYLAKKIYAKALTQPQISNSPFYNHRQSQFEMLPTCADAIVFLGDSITNEGEWAEWFEDLKIKNRGISADTTAGVLSRLNSIVESKPKKVFLMIGINDLWRDSQKSANIIAVYKEILSQFQIRTPNTTVFVQSLLPIHHQLLRSQFSFIQSKVDNTTIAQFNIQLKALAEAFSYPFIDVFSVLLDDRFQLSTQYTEDGIHLNGQAYKVWQQILQPYVLE